MELKVKKISSEGRYQTLLNSIFMRDANVAYLRESNTVQEGAKISIEPSSYKDGRWFPRGSILAEIVYDKPVDVELAYGNISNLMHQIPWKTPLENKVVLDSKALQTPLHLSERLPEENYKGENNQIIVMCSMAGDKQGPDAYRNLERYGDLYLPENVVVKNSGQPDTVQYYIGGTFGAALVNYPELVVEMKFGEYRSVDDNRVGELFEAVQKMDFPAARAHVRLEKIVGNYCYCLSGGIPLK